MAVRVNSTGRGRAGDLLNEPAPPGGLGVRIKAEGGAHGDELVPPRRAQGARSAGRPRRCRSAQQPGVAVKVRSRNGDPSILGREASILERRGCSGTDPPTCRRFAAISRCACAPFVREPSSAAWVSGGPGRLPVVVLGDLAGRLCGSFPGVGDPGTRPTTATARAPSRSADPRRETE